MFLELLKNEYQLSELEQGLFLKTIRQLQKEDRRYYYKHLKPKEVVLKGHLRQYYATLDDEMQKKWVESVAQSMLSRGGEPNIMDSLVMNAIGRIAVYNYMRKKAEKEGIQLNALTNFGGMSAVIMLVGVLTALYIYFFTK